MTTVLKPKKIPLDSSKNLPAVSAPPISNAMSSLKSSASVEKTKEMTVEQYLESQFEDLIKDFREYTQTLVDKLRDEYTKTAEEIQKAGFNQSSDSTPPPVATLKVVAGPHIGQKFRLESQNGSKEDEFKMGRSTGRLFKEKGVSLYKDKEISTTHAKIEFKNGGVFLIDMKSTNGTQLNEEDVEESIPYKLAEGDKITMGSTVLLVHLSILPDDA